jgi:hypothetical protein
MRLERVSVPKSVTLTDVVCVSASQVASRVGDEIAILGLDDGVYYGLDPVGARIWELLQQPTPLSRVLATLVLEFEVDEGTAQSDLLVLVSDLLEKKLVELRPRTR